MWQKLMDFNEEWIYHGAILRFPGEYPYEDYVDFMVYEPMPFEDCMGFMVVTGFKAGLSAQLVPLSAMPQDSKRAFSSEWLKNNWSTWVYPSASVDSVFILKNYEPSPAVEV